jgi:MOSC domain-containing protein
VEEHAGRVVEVWRYPVKSMGGERVDRADVTPRGLVDDRRWAVVGRDGRIGSGKTTRRFRRMPGLLSLTAALGPGGVADVTFPGGERLRVDDPAAAARVSEVVGEPVAIAEEGEVSHFDAAPLHLVSGATLDWLAARHPATDVERRRFRPNLVVALDVTGATEDDWLGARLFIGGVEATVEAPTERCVMVAMAQPGLAPAHRLLKDLTAVAGACLGVYASVALAGTVGVGDDVVVVR